MNIHKYILHSVVRGVEPRCDSITFFNTIYFYSTLFPLHITDLIAHNWVDIGR